MKVELQTKSGQNCVSKMVRTRTAGSPIYKRTIYIDGVFEYHMLENGTTYEKNYVHVMDNTSRIATIKTGNDFGDTTPAIKYNLEDHLGSSSILLKDNGTIINKEEFYPFGETSFGSYAKKRYRYSGKEKDQESGLYYYGARYYTAWTCRFISIDPLAADYPYLTPYNYAGNKPINDKDIDGLQSTKDQKVNNSGGTNIIGPPVNSGEKNKKGEEAAKNTTQNMNLHQVYPDGMIPQPGDLPTDLSHLIGSDIYYEARAFDFELRNPEAPVPEYYRDYGHKYLHEFKYETKENLSPEGQIWLEDALINLQLAIEDGLKNNPNIESNSKEFSDFAFETHVDAYVDAGILSLSIIDKVKITLTVEPKDLLSDRGLAQASQVATEQLSMYINHPKFAAKQAGEVILGISNGTIDKEVDKYLEENMGYAVDRSIWKIMLPF